MKTICTHTKLLATEIDNGKPSLKVPAHVWSVYTRDGLYICCVWCLRLKWGVV